MARARKRPRPAGIIQRVTRPPILVGIGFAVIAAGIVANAIFLQSARHPAPFFATRPVEGPRAPAPDPLVSALQSALTEAGYYTGPVDGIAGPQTVSAISTFERNAGRLVTGRPDSQLLATIQGERAAPVQARPPAVAAPSATVESRPADPQVAAVQEALAKAAYGPLLADGLLGQQTRDAIARFQRDHDLPPTGEINDALILELRASGALAGD